MNHKTTLLIALFFLSFNAFAENGFLKANKFLNSFSNLTADFRQTTYEENNGASESFGKITIAKDYKKNYSKIKIDYYLEKEKSDLKMTIILNKKLLIHQDHELETTYYENINNHTLTSLFKPNIKLEDLKGKILKSEKNDLAIIIPGNQDNFILNFVEGKINQISNQVNGVVTGTMRIYNIEYPNKISKETFIPKEFSK